MATAAAITSRDSRANQDRKSFFKCVTKRSNRFQPKYRFKCLNEIFVVKILPWYNILTNYQWKWGVFCKISLTPAILTIVTDFILKMTSLASFFRSSMTWAFGFDSMLFYLCQIYTDMAGIYKVRRFFDLIVFNINITDVHVMFIVQKSFVLKFRRLIGLKLRLRSRWLTDGLGVSLQGLAVVALLVQVVALLLLLVGQAETKKHLVYYRT